MSRDGAGTDAVLGSGVVRFAVIGAIVVNLLILLSVTLWVWHEHARAIAEGSRFASNMVHVLEEQTSRTIQAVDLTLGGMITALRVRPDLPENDHEFRMALHDRVKTLPFIRALFVIGPDGFITHDTDYPKTPRVSLADREYFAVQQRNPNLGLYIGLPLISRSVGRWFVSLSRRIEDADGNFKGIVVAAMEPLYFGAFYDELRLGDDDGITVFLRDGTLLLRHPHRDDLIGKSFADRPIFREHLPANPNGEFQTVSVFDEERRLVAYRSAQNYPLVVAVGLSELALLADWRWSIWVAYSAAGLAALVSTTLIWLLLRYQKRYSAAHAAHFQRQHLDTVGRMSGGVAHDFNNLLAVIAGCVRLIRRSAENPAEVARHVETLGNAVDRGAALTTRLLALAKRQELNVQQVNINDLLEGLEPLMRHAADAKVGIALQLQKPLWPCQADTTQFDSAMLNLIVNARDAMPDGGEIRVQTENVAAHPFGPNPAEADCVAVTVTDTGIGIPAGLVGRVTEPFFTTKGESGTGLGLSQTVDFMRRIGGNMQIDSTLGKGTSVRLLFPRTPTPGQE